MAMKVRLAATTLMAACVLSAATAEVYDPNTSGKFDRDGERQNNTAIVDNDALVRATDAKPDRLSRYSKTIAEWKKQAFSARTQDVRLQAALAITRISSRPDLSDDEKRECRLAAMKLYSDSNEHIIVYEGFLAICIFGDGSCRKIINSELSSPNQDFYFPAIQFCIANPDDSSIAALVFAALQYGVRPGFPDASKEHIEALRKIETPDARKGLEAIRKMSKSARMRELASSALDTLEVTGGRVPKLPSDRKLAPEEPRHNSPVK